LSAKSFDSRNPCHSDVVISEVASLQLDFASSVESESSDSSTRAISLNCSSLPRDKLLNSSNDTQLIYKANGASSKNGTHSLKEKYHCNFCKRDGHIVEFCFCHVKHERRVRAKAFRNTHCRSPDMCVPSVDSNLSKVGASSSKTQGTPHMSKNDDLSPLYH